MKIATAYEDRKIVVEKSFGETLAESIEMFGEEKVHAHFVRNARSTLQGYVSRMLKAGKTDAEILKAAEAWNLEGRRSPQSTVDKALDFARKMTPEQLAEFVKAVKAQKLAA